MEDEVIDRFEVAVIDEDIARIGAIALDIRNKIKKYVKRPEDLRRLGVCMFEAEANLAIHSTGGAIAITVYGSKITVNAMDSGPGIPDIDKALTPGYSTAPPWARELGFGSGMGLKNIKRLADVFSIVSSEKGTMLVFEIKTDENS
jgi:anti-sigma regulatory factor (Ser/Thr protein kinase)